MRFLPALLLLPACATSTPPTAAKQTTPATAAPTIAAPSHGPDGVVTVPRKGKLLVVINVGDLHCSLDLVGTQTFTSQDPTTWKVDGTVLRLGIEEMSPWLATHPDAAPTDILRASMKDLVGDLGRDFPTGKVTAADITSPKGDAIEVAMLDVPAAQATPDLAKVVLASVLVGHDVVALRSDLAASAGDDGTARAVQRITTLRVSGTWIDPQTAD
jgi:hypothetical protein